MDKSYSNEIAEINKILSELKEIKEKEASFFGNGQLKSFIRDLKECKEVYQSTVNDLMKIKEVNELTLSQQRSLIDYIKKYGTEVNESSDQWKALGENARKAFKELASTSEGQAKIKAMTDAQKKLNDQLEDSNIKVKKNSEAWNNYRKSVYGLSPAFNDITNGIKSLIGFWAEMDHQAHVHARTIGAFADEAKKYRDYMFRATTDIAMKYGMKQDDIMKLQQSYNEATGRSIIATRRNLDGFASSSKIIGAEGVKSITEAVDNLGGSAEQAIGAMQNGMARAKNRGVEMNVQAKNLVSALKISQKFTFKDGVTGMSRMAAKAAALKMDLNSVANFGEKFMGVEDAIKTSAQLQVLGGNVGRAFANPLHAMNLAMTNFEGFGDLITDSLKGMAVFNSKTGRSELSPYAMLQLRQMSQSTGMSYEDLANQAMQMSKRGEIEKAIAASPKLRGLSDDLKEFLINKGDLVNGRWSITNANGETKAFSELNDTIIEQFKKQQTPEDMMRDDISSMRKGVDKMSNLIGESQSLKEVIDGGLAALKAKLAEYLGPLMDWIPKAIKGATSIMKDMGPLGTIAAVGGAMVGRRVVGGALGALGTGIFQKLFNIGGSSTKNLAYNGLSVGLEGPPAASRVGGGFNGEVSKEVEIANRYVTHGSQTQRGSSFVNEADDISRLSGKAKDTSRFAKFNKAGKVLGKAASWLVAAQTIYEVGENSKELDKISRNRNNLRQNYRNSRRGKEIFDIDEATFAAYYNEDRKLKSQQRQYEDANAKAIGMAVGTAVGSLLPGVGSLVGSIAGAWIGNYAPQIRNVLFGGEEKKSMPELMQEEFEHNKVGLDNVKRIKSQDELYAKAAYSVIGIHDLLISKDNASRGLTAEGNKKENPGFFGRIRDKLKGWWNGYPTGGVVSDGGLNLPNGDTTPITAQKGEFILNKQQQGRLYGALFGNGDITSRSNINGPAFIKPIQQTSSVGKQDFNINFGGSLTLKGDRGMSTQINASDFAKNQEFMNMLYQNITRALDKRGQFGVGYDKNSGAMSSGYATQVGRLA